MTMVTRLAILARLANRTWVSVQSRLAILARLAWISRRTE
jgi:hypothetical protein